MKTRENQPSFTSWLSARSQNALKRKIFASIVIGAVFVVVLLGLITMPREVVIPASFAASLKRPDTALVVAKLDVARKSIARYDSLLISARREAGNALARRSSTIDTVSLELRIERDSLIRLLDELSIAMERASASPLPPAFRNLATTRLMGAEPRVKVLVDSLDLVERLREPFGALGAGDPIYVSLSSLLNELGRSIRDIATEKRAEIRSRIAPLMPIPAPPVDIGDAVDSLSILYARTDAIQDFEIATQVLNDMRSENASIDSILANRRRVANTDAPPLARIVSALVIAVFVGFAIILGLELRNPRLANKREAESVTGVRVLTIIHPAEKLFDRERRKADTELPPVVDVVSDRYRVLYLHLTAADAKIEAVAITGSESDIVSAVSSNIAATAAYEASSTLLIDADTVRGDIASIFKIDEEKKEGLNKLLNGKATWTEAAVPVGIGRDRTMDVLVGSGDPLTDYDQKDVERVRSLLLKMQQRYDMTVLSGPLKYVQLASNTIIPSSNVIVCAHIGYTHLSSLRNSVIELQKVGRRVIGLVIWDDDNPRIGT